MQIAVSLAGLGLMIGVAWIATWYRSLPTLFTVPVTMPVEDEPAKQPRAAKPEQPEIVKASV